MASIFPGNATFWRACCLVTAFVAAIEALGLVLVERPSPAPAAAAASKAVPVLPITVVPAPAVNEQELTPSRRSASSRKHARAARGPRERSRAWEDHGSALAKDDPEAALRALADLAPGAERNATTRGIFEVLALGDAARAVAYAKQTRGGGEREAALTTLLEGWTGPADDKTPERRARSIASLGLEAGLGMELLQGDAPRPDLAVLWAQELTSSEAKAELLGAAAGAQVNSDPALAASYGSGLTAKDQLTFNEQLISSWAPSQPEAAWQWSSGLTDPGTRAKAQNATVESQSYTDPQGASTKLALLPDGDQRTETLKVVAENYANKNTDAALAWAESLPPADGAVANAAISSVTPTGVGVMLTSQEGYPTVSNLVPNMGAAQSGLIHSGDRIVGVSQGNNQFVDVQQLDTEVVAKLVRGSAGSLVQLQIAPSLPGGGYGQPTVVPVIRRPIKHGG